MGVHPSYFWGKLGEIEILWSSGSNYDIYVLDEWL